MLLEKYSQSDVVRIVIAVAKSTKNNIKKNNFFYKFSICIYVPFPSDLDL